MKASYFVSISFALIVSSVAQSADKPENAFDLTNAPNFIIDTLKNNRLRLLYGYLDDDYRLVHLGFAGAKENKLIASLDYHFSESAADAIEAKEKRRIELTQFEPTFPFTIRDESMPGEEANFQVKKGESTYILFRRANTVVSVLGYTDEAETWKRLAFAADSHLKEVGNDTAREELLAMFPEEIAVVQPDPGKPELTEEEKLAQYAEHVKALQRHPIPKQLDRNATFKDKHEFEDAMQARSHVIGFMAQLKVPASKELLSSIASDRNEGYSSRRTVMQTLGELDPPSALRIAYQILKEIPPQAKTDELNILNMAGLRNECLRVVLWVEKRERSVAFFKDILRDLDAEAEMTRQEFGERIPWLLDQEK